MQRVAVWEVFTIILKKSIHRVALILAIILGLTACKSNNGGEEKMKYIIPEYNEDLVMDIGAWDGPALHQMRQSGFDYFGEADFTIIFPMSTHMDFGGDIDRALTYMDRAYKAGMKVVCEDTKFLGAWYHDAASGGSTEFIPADYSRVEYYKDHPAFYGMRISDEPQASQFEIIRMKLDEFEATFPGKMSFVNVCPYREGFYETYVDEYMQTIKPEFLSYDDYAMLADGTIRQTYFKTLAYIKAKAEEYGVPAHTFLLSVGHGGERAYRNPSLADLRWQIACAFAYGYDWFSHFNCTPLNGTYEMMIGKQGGEPTPLYYDVQTVNKEVHKWDNVYLSFDWIGTAPIIGSHGRANEMFALINDGIIKLGEIEGIKDIATNEDLLFGVFEDAKGNRGFMAVNATNPYEGIPSTVTVEFDGYQGVMVYAKGEPEIIDLADGKVTLDLESGEGKFLIPLKGH